jgi:hypothetical protein
MEIKYIWKTRLFSSRYELYRYETLEGELRSAGWRKKTGELSGKKVLFEIKGFFDRDFLISDPDTKTLLGNISFSNWRRTATITLLNKTYTWNSIGFFRKKWTISDENNVLISYDTHFKNGEITSTADNEILVLTGLFIREYLKQREAAAAAAAT